MEIYIAKYLIFLTPVFLMIYIWKHDNKKLALIESCLIGGGAALGWVLANIIKNILKIPRPEIATDVLFRNESLYSFPSGHTTFFFTLGTMMFFYHRKISYVIFALGALVGYCRVLINVHFPIDILGGIAIGIFVGNLIFTIYRKYIKDKIIFHILPRL